MKPATRQRLAVQAVRAIPTLLTSPQSALPLVAIMFANIVSLFMVSVAGFMVEGAAITKYVRNMHRLSFSTMNRLTLVMKPADKCQIGIESELKHVVAQE